MTDIDEIKKGILKPDEKLQKFDEHGITEDYLLGKLKEELEAEETKFFHQKGKVVETKNVIAWGTRQDARKDAHKLKGDYPAERHEHTGDVIFHSNVPEPDMPEEEAPAPEESKEYSPKPSGEEMKKHLNEWIDGKPPPPEEPPSPDQDQEKEFKDHHRSRREGGK